MGIRHLFAVRKLGCPHGQHILPDEHYMVDISEKVRQIVAMVEKGQYFTINSRIMSAPLGVDLSRLDMADDVAKLQISRFKQTSHLKLPHDIS